MEQVPPDTKERTPSSRVLEDLLDQAPADYFTLGWRMSTLHQRSFGIVILFLGLLATAPIGSTVPGLVIAVVAVQMIAGRCELVFPRFHHRPKLADALSIPPWWARYSCTAIS